MNRTFLSWSLFASLLPACASLLLACASHADVSPASAETPKPASPAPDAGASAADAPNEKPKVLVQLMVFRADKDFASPKNGAATPALTFASLARDPAIAVMSSPHVLLESGESSSMVIRSPRADGGTDANGELFQVYPTLLPSEDIRIELNIEMTAPDPDRRLHAKMTATVRDGQALIGSMQASPRVTTQKPDERWLFAMEARIIRGHSDMKRIYDEKLRERNESVSPSDALRNDAAEKNRNALEHQRNDRDGGQRPQGRK